MWWWTLRLGLLIGALPLSEVVKSWITSDSWEMSCWVWGGWHCMATIEVVGGVSPVLMGVVPVSMAGCLA